MSILVNCDGLFYNGYRLVNGVMKIVWSKEQCFVFGDDQNSIDDLKEIKRDNPGSTIKGFNLL